MLEFIRTHLKKYFAGSIVAVMVVLLVVAFGISPRLGVGQKSVVFGNINGRPITREEFLLNAQDVHSQLQYQYRLMGQKREIPQYLIMQQTKKAIEAKYLATFFAKEYKLEPSFAKLMDFIKENMTSKRSPYAPGVFDIQAYKNYKEHFKRRGINFDNEMKRRYCQKFIYDLIGSSIFVGDKELKNYYKVADHKIKINYFIAKPKFESKVSYPQKQIQEYYNSHKQQYKVKQERYHVSEIFLKEKTVNAQKILNDVLSDLKQNKIKFAEAARKHSQDASSKARGGDKGWLGYKQMLQPMAEAVKKMKVDEISGIIKTARGYHIVKLTGKLDKGDTKPMSMVKSQIINHFNNVAKNKAQNKLLQELQKINKRASLKGLAKNYNAELYKDREFSKFDPIPGVQDQKKVKKALFDPQLSVKENRVISTKNGVVVFKKLAETAFEEKEFTKKLKNKRQQYRSKLHNFYYSEWLKAQKKRYKIDWKIEKLG
jgi:hypothetical protein